jgi:hypothetical protein
MHQRSITSGIESQLLTELEEYRIKEYELEQRKEHRQLPAPVADAQLFTIRGIIRAKEEDLVALRRKPVSDVDG